MGGGGGGDEDLSRVKRWLIRQVADQQEYCKTYQCKMASEIQRQPWKDAG